MNFEQWEVDVAEGSATHASGFTLRIEGNPRDPSEVYPGKFPSGLSFPDQARLLRCGLEALAKAGKSGGAWGMPKPELISEAAKKREEIAKVFAEREDKPKRSVLSLKKSS